MSITTPCVRVLNSAMPNVIRLVCAPSRGERAAHAFGRGLGWVNQIRHFDYTATCFTTCPTEQDTDIWRYFLVKETNAFRYAEE